MHTCRFLPEQRPRAPSPPKVGKVSGEARRMGYGGQVREARVFAATFRVIGLQVEAAAHTPSGRLRRPPSPNGEKGCAPTERCVHLLARKRGSRGRGARGFSPFIVGRPRSRA